tara:strand:- start:27 stop:248 length:222 start_codon:yes stop_codon:yes gene_type:complete
LFGWDVSWNTTFYLSGLWIVILILIGNLILAYILEKEDPTKSPQLRILLLLITVIVLVMILFTFIMLGADSAG